MANFQRRTSLVGRSPNRPDTCVLRAACFLYHTLRPVNGPRMNRKREGKFSMPETPQEYTKRIMSNLQGADPAKVQAATPKKIERLMKGASAAKLRKRPAPGKWSVAEIVAHLADDEIVIGWRMRQILGAPGTPLQPFDQDAWAAAMHYEKRDARKSLAEFRAVREANLALLKYLSPRTMEAIRHARRTRRGINSPHRRASGRPRPQSSRANRAHPQTG